MKILTQIINDLVGNSQNIIINFQSNQNLNQILQILHQKLEILIGNEFLENSLICLSTNDEENFGKLIRDEKDFMEFMEICGNSKRISIQAKIIPKNDQPENSHSITSQEPSIYSDVSDSEMAIFDRYQKKKFIDSGAFGKVYKVKKGNEKFALKVIDSEKTSSSQLNFILQEVLISTSMNHLNIVATRDVFFESNKLCIEMDWVPKGNLFERIKKRKISLSSAIFVWYQMVDVLCYLKDKRMIHRDIKPNNIMIDEIVENDCLLVKLGDFGLARRKIFLNEHPFKLEGTMNYLPNEVLERMFTDIEYPSPYSYASDMFALGVTIFQLLTLDCSVSFPHLMKQSTPEKFYKWIEIQIGIKCPKASPQFIELLISMLRFQPKDRIKCNDLRRFIHERTDFVYSLDEIENRFILEFVNGKLFNTLNGLDNLNLDLVIEEPNINEIMDLEDEIDEEEEEGELDSELLDILDEISANDPKLEKIDTISNDVEENELKICAPKDIAFNDMEEEVIVLNGDDTLLILDRKNTKKRRVLELDVKYIQFMHYQIFESQSTLLLITRNSIILINMQGKQIWKADFISGEEYSSVCVDTLKGKIYLLCKYVIHVYSIKSGMKLDDIDHPVFRNFNIFGYDMVNSHFYIERDGKIEIFTTGLQYISHFVDTYEKIIKIQVDGQAQMVISLEDVLLNIIDASNPQQSTFSYETLTSICLDRKNRHILALTDQDTISIYQY